MRPNLNGLPTGVNREEAERANRAMGQRQEKTDREIAEDIAEEEAQKEDDIIARERQTEEQTTEEAQMSRAMKAGCKP